MLPDTPETRLEMAGFLASCRIFDRAVGAVLDAIDRNGYRENTFVFITTDHGLPMPGMKVNLTDGGTGVMLLMRGPGGFDGGKVVDSLVSQVDVFPTICDMLGIAPSERLQGTSLMPVIRGKTDKVRDEIFTELIYHGSYNPMRAIRTDRWKYIRCYDPEAPGKRSDPGPAKDLWLKYGWPEHLDAEEQLYDVIFDPNEANNLTGDPRFESVRMDLAERLEIWQRETGDPLLDGPMPPRTTEGLGYVPK